MELKKVEELAKAEMNSLSKGLPIKAEIEALQTYLEGIDKDSVLDLVLSSLPEETISHGTDTVLQLNHQVRYFCYHNDFEIGGFINAVILQNLILSNLL
ncbi:hypothetical protein BT93_D1193 [Corymbia citriodora subsp. variegata]|nr:hypothetical protein BT93_D1193 [Corymbia citriodora subsp. variegata]